MEADPLRYDRWIEEALRHVVRRALEHTAQHGLPGEHHFYITFQTSFPGVELPGYLRAQYPDEITIVLQNRFWDLDLSDDVFALSLTFNGKVERLRIPFPAIVAFADPSVKFGLQLRVDLDGEDLSETLANGDDEDLPFESAEDLDESRPDKGSASEAGGDNVVALDTFRKK
ncbi:ClpXP protease specificity-enhancing factor SspB [Magnetospira thiophila]